MKVGFSAEKLGVAQNHEGRVPQSILHTLEELSEHAQLRTLPKTVEGVDFHSNDYLGLARTPLDMHSFQIFLERYRSSVGATGSRLISGNRSAVEDFERYLASFHETDAALLFNSGFEANTALIGSLGRRGTTFLYDEYVHASIREGLRVGFAKNYSFRHNDLKELEELLQRNSGGEVYVVVESVYSMDGDVSPLVELVQLCEDFKAFLIVDEAHSTGVYGTAGEGLVQSLDLQRAVFARVHTFGKAVGFRGACVVGAQPLIDYMVNKARPFIYSTAPDLFSVWWSQELYKKMAERSEERDALFSLCKYFHSQSESSLIRITSAQEPDGHSIACGLIRNGSPIQGILCPGNREVQRLESYLRSRGFGVKAIRSPTVPQGKERVRISLHSFNTQSEVDHLIATLREVQMKGGM